MVLPCHGSSVSSLCQSLSLHTSRGLTGQLYMCPSIWVSVVFVNDEIEVMRFWQERHRGDIGPFPVYHVEGP